MLPIWLTCSSFRCFAKPSRGSSGFSNERYLTNWLLHISVDSASRSFWRFWNLDLAPIVDLLFPPPQQSSFFVLPCPPSWFKSSIFVHGKHNYLLLAKSWFKLKSWYPYIVVQRLNSCWQSSSFLVVFLLESIQNLDSNETDVKFIFPFLYKRSSVLLIELFVL